MRYTRISNDTYMKTNQREPIRYFGLNKKIQKTRGYGSINDRHCLYTETCVVYNNNIIDILY